MQIKRKRNLGAFGLLESVVAIGVFGASIIVGLSLIVKSLGIIKDNQISDQAAAFMVTSLEYMRSPIVKANTLSEDYYHVVINNNQIAAVQVDPSASLLDETNCSEGSVFFVDVDGPDSSALVCNQLTVQKVNNSDPNSNLIITSRIVYKLSKDTITREIRGFKNYNIEL
jgi:type II secretory pathway pseudopilin PulG